MAKREIYEGMAVRSPEGEKLGKIGKIAADSFTYEKGLLNKERHEARFADILDVTGDGVILAMSSAGYGATEAGTGGAGFGKSEEMRVPVVEEELDVSKRVKDTGAVRVTKHVETEERQLKVPIRREEVRVERVAPSGDRAASEASFGAGETISVPIREEEIEIRKRPVVREEVRISKQAFEEEREVSEPLRREVAEVRTEGDVGPARGEPDKY